MVTTREVPVNGVPTMITMVNDHYHNNDNRNRNDTKEEKNKDGITNPAKQIAGLGGIGSICAVLTLYSTCYLRNLVVATYIKRLNVTNKLIL